ncbi:MAG: MFS transporter [Blastocatellia bacterium]
MKSTAVIDSSEPALTTIPARNTATQGVSPLLKQRAISYYAAYFSLGAMVSALGPMLPALARQTGSQLKEISSLFISRSLGYVLGSFLAGRLYDRARGHRVLMTALISLAALTTLTSQAPFLWTLAILFLLQGLAGSGISVGGNTLMMRALHGMEPARAGKRLGGLHFCWGVGAFLSPIIFAWLMNRMGTLLWPSLALGLLSIPACLLISRTSEPARAPHLADTGALTPARLDHVLVGVFICFFFVYTGTEACFGNWIYTYALTTQLGNTTTAAYLNSAFWGSLTAGRLLAIPLSARLRPRHILTADLCGGLLSVALMFAFQHSGLALWIATCGLGLSLASIFPTTLLFAQRRMRLSGSLTGMFYGSASAGAMVMPWGIGQFFDAVGPQTLIYMTLTGLCAEFILFVMLMRYPLTTPVRTD